jgi:hypothetical protein
MMAHWAELDENNVVLRVTVGSNEEPDEGYQWLLDNLGGRWLKTSYNTRFGKRIDPISNEKLDEPGFRGNYAVINGTYHEDIDAFMPPKDFPSWIIDVETYTWIPPVPKPDSGMWIWDEPTVSWKEYDGE